MEIIDCMVNQFSESARRELFKDWLTTNNGAAAGPKIWSTLLEKLKSIVDLAAAREENWLRCIHFS